MRLRNKPAIDPPGAGLLLFRALNGRKAESHYRCERGERQGHEEPVQRDPRPSFGGDRGQQAEHRAAGTATAQRADQVRVHLRTYERGAAEQQLGKGGIESKVLLSAGNPQQRVDGHLEDGHSDPDNKDRDQSGAVPRRASQQQ